MTTDVHINSEYGFWPYVIAVLYFLFFAIVPLAIGAGIVGIRGILLRRFVVTTIHTKILAGLVVFSAVCLFTAIAFAAGFWVIHTALAAFFDIVVWAVLAPLAVFLGGPHVRLIIDPAGAQFGTSPEKAAAATATADTLKQTTDEDQELELLGPGFTAAKTERAFPEPALGAPEGGIKFELSSQSEAATPPLSMPPRQSSAASMPPRHGSASTSHQQLVVEQPLLVNGGASPNAMSRDSTSRFLNTSSATTPKTRSPHVSTLEDRPLSDAPFFTTREAPSAADQDDAPLKRFARVVLHDLKDRPLIHAAAFFGGLVGAALLLMLVHNSCVCNKPQVMTTWATRASSTNHCPANGTPCFTYAMIGADCDTLTIVSHYVVANGFSPQQVHAEYCLRPSGATTPDACAGTWVTQPGVVRDNTNLIEDARYLGHIRLNGLQCGAAYSVKVAFTSPGSTASAIAPTMCTHTTPRSTPTAAGTNGVPAVSFVGGGDYVVRSEGKDLMRMAMRERPNASFAFIGGDVGYANNMRTCYRRVDEMLVELLEVLRYPADQCVVPLAVAMGNHDGGGYQWAGASAYATQAGRAAHTAFYSYYYPMSSVPVTATPAEDRLADDWTSTIGTRIIGGVAGWTTLDTGHVFALDAAQTRYFRDAMTHMRDRANLPAIVMYHVPAYPSVRESDSSSTKVDSAAVRQVFGPILDEFDDVITLVFENHDHAYKRTHRIRGEAVVSPTGAGGRAHLRQRGRGVVFTGDGALGANDPDKEASIAGGRGARAKASNYVIVADILTNGTVVARSLSPSGDEIDAFVAV